MSLLSILKERSKSLLYAVVRFPAAVLSLAVMASVLTLETVVSESYSQLEMALAVTVFFAIFAHFLIEKEGKDLLRRLVLIPAASAVGILYYFVGLQGWMSDGDYYGSERLALQTIIVCVIFLLLFMALQSLRNKIPFGPVFMSVFKAFFTSIFFSVVIWGGLSLITVAIDELLFTVSENVYLYIAIWIWLLVAPVIFLSLLMTYKGDKESQARDQKISSCPAFFRILLLYVIIPLLSIYTMVLVIYLIKTLISGEGKELLEPLILSYSIAVIAVFFLVSEIDNKLAAFYRLVFPKSMGIIALYQVVVSFMNASKEGVVFEEYFLILFSVFAVVVAVTMSIFPVKKNVIHILILAGFALVSILPIVNFYQVSVNSQVNVLTNALERNSMIQNREVIKNDSVIESDRILITRAAEFLFYQQELNQVINVPDKISIYDQFVSIFGFEREYSEEIYFGSDVKIYEMDRDAPIPVEGADYILTRRYFDPATSKSETSIGIIMHNGEAYQIEYLQNESGLVLMLTDSSGTAILTAPIEEAIDSLKDVEVPATGVMSPEDMRFDYESETVSITVYFQSVFMYPDAEETGYDLELTILVDFF